MRTLFGPSVPAPPARPRRPLFLVALLSVIPWLWGCKRATPSAKAVASGAGLPPAWSPTPTPGDPEVAKVDGVSILTSEVARHARQTGLPPRKALDDLIARELAAKEAAAGGFASLPEVSEVRSQEMVRKIVTTDFYGKPSNRNMRLEDARKVYDNMVDYFHHGKLFKVHNVCTTPEIAKKIFDALKNTPPQNAAEFQSTAKANGVNKIDEIVTSADSQKLAEAWRQAIFAALKKPGDIMPPTPLPKLPYPCTTHLAYLEEVRAPRDSSFEAALPEIRERAETDWQRHAFMVWANAFLDQYKVHRMPENLETF